jgi:co-chaperonin GroES (HSP10)
MTKNTSGVLPTEFKVLIEEKKVEERIGSIILPDQVKERDQYAQTEGVLVAVSPLAFT